MRRYTKHLLLFVVPMLLCAWLQYLKGAARQPSTGKWITVGAMTSGRNGACAALLPDGRILITGGADSSGALASAEFFNVDGSFASAASLSYARSRHSCVAFKDGRVLVAGGSSNGGALNVAELYDPATGQWQIAGDMLAARTGHTASRLQDGRVLFAGGESAGVASASLEIFDPVTNMFQPVLGVLSSPRKDHAAAVLPDGRVLIAGGSDGTQVLATADIFDPATGSVSSAGTLSVPRTGHTATTLLDGRVFLAGGNDGTADLASAEIYDSTAGSFSPTASMISARRDHLAFRVPDNNSVLLAGGSSAGAPLPSTELFIPWTGEFKATGALSTSGLNAAGSPLKTGGRVLMAGGAVITGGATSSLKTGGRILAAGGAASAIGAVFAAATVMTDQPDYAPGDPVVITGSGWQPGETVSLLIHETPANNPDTTLTAVADAAGNISNSQFVVPLNDVGVTFTLTATGQTSGLTAQTAFTDGNVKAFAAPAGVTFTLTKTSYSSSTNCTTGAGAPTTVFGVDSSLGNTTGVGSTASVKWQAAASSDQGGAFVNWTSTNPFTDLGGGAICVPGFSGAGSRSYFANYSTNVNTTTTVSSSANPSVFGQSVTLTATVTAGTGTPTGTVTFKDGLTTLGTGTLSAGQTTFTTSSLSVGTHSITAAYSGAAGFNPSTSAALTQTVNKADTTTTVTSSANPSVLGQSVTFTAAVSAVAPGSGTPTGTVTFTDGVTTLGTGALNALGQATFSTSSLTAGPHSITASYGGDGNFNTSASAALAQTVNKAGTTTTVISSANPSVFGQSVTFTATVSAAAPATGTPTGTVTFKDGVTILGTGTLNPSGQATFTTSSLSVAAHSITAEYGGDITFSLSTSAVLTQTVNKANTSTTVVSSANPSVFGQSVTFTATVTVAAPGVGTPSGTVTFKDGVTILGTGALNASGQATFTTSSLSVAAHSITAEYGGDINFNLSTSAVLTQTVNKANTNTTVVSSANPSVFGQSVTFTAAVSAVAPGSGTPTGTVTFTDGVTTLGTGTLNASGQATFTTSSLGVGAHSVTASYGGDGNFNTSASAALAQTVNKANTTATVTSSANPSVFGQSVTFTATVTPVAPGAGAPTGTVTFTIDGVAQAPVALSGSMASISTSSLAVSPPVHTVTAVYNGDSNFNASPAGSLTGGQTVNKANTTTTIGTVTPEPSVTGQSYTVNFTVTVNPPGAGTPSGNVTVSDGASSCTAALPATSCSLASTTAGAKTLTATYAGDSNFNGSSGTKAHTVNKANTTTAIGTVTPEPTVTGQSYTVNFTVTVNAPGAGTPGGNVTVSDGASSCTVALPATSCSLASTTAGAKTLTATYAGDSNFNGSSGTKAHQVNPAATSTSSVASSANPSLFGQAVTFTATVSVVSPGGGIPTGTVTFMNGAATLGTGTLNSANPPTATYTTALLAAGSYSIKAVYTTDGNYLGSTSLLALTQVVNPYPVTATVTASPNPQQYSDKVTFTVSLAGARVNGQSPTSAASTVTFSIGGLSLGSCTLADAGDLLNYSFSCSTALIALVETGPAAGNPPSGPLKPGAKTVVATFSSVNPNFTIANTGSLTINPEDVRATYTGLSFISTACPTCSTATVPLSATIKDVTAVTGDPQTDPNPGDIRNATVTFVNRDAGNAPLCTAPVGLVSLSDTTVGTASCNWAANLGPQSSTSVNVGITVSNYYTDDSSTEDMVVTVSLPLTTNFITGGGYLVMTSSSGQLPGALNSKNNFGFNVKYNNGATNLQGNVNAIVRSAVIPGGDTCGPAGPDGLHVYQIKGNSMTSLTVTPTASGGTATFLGKASIQDVTNPKALPCSIDGGLTFQVTMTDMGQPGSSDTIGITAWQSLAKGGGLWFSSNWNGTKTAEQLLGGGNLVVH